MIYEHSIDFSVPDYVAGDVTPIYRGGPAGPKPIGIGLFFGRNTNLVAVPKHIIGEDKENLFTSVSRIPFQEYHELTEKPHLEKAFVLKVVHDTAHPFSLSYHRENKE